MKTNLLFAVICGAALGALAQTNLPQPPLAGAARAATTRDTGPDTPRSRADEMNRRAEGRRAARIEKAKLNTLSTLAGMGLGTNFLEKWDLNHNGRIDPHEWMLFRKDQQRRIAESRG